MLSVDCLRAPALADGVLLLPESQQKRFHSSNIGAIFLGLRVKCGDQGVGEQRLGRERGNGLVWVWAGHRKLASIASQPLFGLDNQQIEMPKRVANVVTYDTISLFPTSPKRDILHPDYLLANPNG